MKEDLLIIDCDEILSIMIVEVVGCDICHGDDDNIGIQIRTYGGNGHFKNNNFEGNGQG